MELRGSRVTIRPVAWHDLPTICGWWNDPIVMREVHAENWKPALDQVLKDAWPAWRDPGPSEYHEFVICLGDRTVGEIGYIYEDLDQRTVSVDIKIGEPSLWGQGLGTEAMRLLVFYLFDHMNAQRVIARPGDWNTRSMRLLEKCGFREIGCEETPATDTHKGIIGGGVTVTMQHDRGW